MKPDPTSGWRRYTFVAAVLGLDPAGKLGLDASDYKVRQIFVLVTYFYSFLFDFLITAFILITRLGEFVSLGLLISFVFLSTNRPWL